MSKKTQKKEKKTAPSIVKEESKPISLRIEWFVILFLVIVLGVSIFTNGFRSFIPEKKVSEDDIKTKVQDHIVNELMQGQGTMDITEIKEDEEYKDLYIIAASINEREYTLYATKDGKYFYIDRYEIKSEEEEVASAQTYNFPKSDYPTAYLFTMSYCPYGNQAEDMVIPVAKLLDGKANIEPHYVIYSNYATNGGASWNEYCSDESQKYCSMHGIQELNQNVRELCTWKYDQDKYWDFVDAANKQCTYQNVDTCWEEVAKSVGLDIDTIKNCEATEKNALLEIEVNLNKQYSVTGSPAIFINEQEASISPRTPENFKNAVCSAFNNEPEECSETLESGSSSTSGSCE